MGLATFRNNDTGELIELSEDWMTRFPRDPYTLVGTDELVKLEIEQRKKAAEAVGAQEYQQPDQIGGVPVDEPDPTPTPSRRDDARDTPSPAGNPAAERRF